VLIESLRSSWSREERRRQAAGAQLQRPDPSPLVHSRPKDAGERHYHHGRMRARRSFVHGGSLDRPLVVEDQTGHAMIPHTNWRGLYDSGTLPSGALLTTHVDWPGRRLLTYLQPMPEALPRGRWYGSLVAEKTDQSGLMYMRNRYYDPATGQFTRADPIGLVGGMNPFGFANGDPLTFSDPFGLCPVCYVAFEVGATLCDAADLAVTGLRYLRGRASGAELTATAGGAAAGVVGFGAGYGRAARSLVREAASDPRLWKKLAFEELLPEARSGIGGRAIAGAGVPSRSIDDISRLVSTHGGEAGDWAKMVGRTREGPGGIAQQVHWYENVRTGLRVEFKPTNPF
jgi:RHS repeat-associated protein